MFGKSDILTVWVGRNRLSIAGGKIGEPMELVIPETVVSHMEVLDRDGLYALIKEWAQQVPVKGSEIVWVFGPDVYFERVMEESEREQWDSIAVGFLELLPFEEVESKVYLAGNQRRVVAVSGEYYKALRRGFALQGYVTKFEIPAMILGKLGEQGGATKAVVKEVNGRLSALEKQRMMEVGGETKYQVVGEGKKKNSSLSILLAVFGVLLVVLAVMLTRMS